MTALFGDPDDLCDRDERVYDRLATGLAALSEPDLSSLTPAEVDKAMMWAYPPTGPRPKWLDALRRRIAHDSMFQTRLEAADPGEFPFRVKEFAASYHRLVSTSGEIRLLVMGPMHPPVQLMTPGADAPGGNDDG